MEWRSDTDSGSGSGFLVSGLWFLVCGFWFLVCGSGLDVQKFHNPKLELYPASLKPRNPKPETRNPEPGTRNPIPLGIFSAV